MARIYESILEAVGQTPMVRLKTVGRRTGCTFYAKCEFMNPGGSVKDRIGRRMVEKAEESGRIKPGDTLIEPTSGNTGIGMAMAAAVKGYRMIITMPEKMSREKQVVLEALGAEIIRTPTEAAWDSPDSHIGVANSACSRSSPTRTSSTSTANPRTITLAHEEGTGRRDSGEQCNGEGRLPWSLTAGTGGTITGVAKRKLKRHDPAHPDHRRRSGRVDPGRSRSDLQLQGRRHRLRLHPDVLDQKIVDEWIKSEDRESFLMARKLIRQEGLLCGGSSGTAMWAAIEVAKRVGPDKRLVVILPDSVRNYMTKFMDDQWMRESGFTERSWEAQTMGDVLRTMPRREVLTATSSDLVADAVMIMKEKGVSQLPVVDDGKLVGIVTESDVLGRLVEGNASLASTVAEVMFRNVRSVNERDDARRLSDIFSEGLVALVVDDNDQLKGLVTKMDLVDVLTKSVEAPVEA